MKLCSTDIAQSLFEANVYGQWSDIRHTRLVKNVYTAFQDINWNNTFFILNYDFWNPEKIKQKFARYVISFHYQYVDLLPIIKFAQENPHSQLLLICDNNDDCNISSLAKNITTASWLTWHHQLSYWARVSGTNQNLQTKRSYKISCLNNRYEFHREVIAACVYNEIDPNQRLLSWINSKQGSPYHLDPDFFIPDSIRSILQRANLYDKQILLPREIDGYQNNWNHPGYTDCYINITTETIFNDKSRIDDQVLTLPGPMLTEKTWKPILGGCCFLPAAQKNTFTKLKDCGFQFALINNFDFDFFDEYDRLLALNELIKTIDNIDLDQLHEICLPVAEHNINNVVSGMFLNNCNAINLANFEKILQWAGQNQP